MRSNDREVAGRWARPLIALHDLLALSGEARPSDAIFVFAGAEERKRYGLALWEQGLAPSIVLSVGRFEWRRVLASGLPSDGGLGSLVEIMPPTRRHYVLTLGRETARAEWVPRGKLGTLAEARALTRLARRLGWRSVLAVTSAAHSRRAHLALRRAIGGAGVQVRTIAVPDALSAVQRSSWWRDRAGRALVFGEILKLPIYWLRARP